MTAETVYNVIQALDAKERPRLFKMLGVKSTVVKKRSKIISDDEAIFKLKKILK